MTDKKKRLWWADLLRGILAVLIVGCAMVAQGKPGPVPLALASAALIVFLAVEFFMNRCPRCGQYMGRNWGQFCQHCGGRVRGEKTQT